MNWQHDTLISLNNVQFFVTETGPLGVNTVIIACKETSLAVVFDPGGNREDIEQIIQDNNFKIEYLIHTHAHFDHCLGTDALVTSLRESNNSELIVALHPDDQVVFDNIGKQGFAFGLRVTPPETKIDKYITDNEIISFGNISMQVIHTPGHSPGSCSFYLGDHGVVVTGDTLFRMGVGRTDLPGGDMGVLKSSILNRLFTLPEETVVIPGHGEFTTIKGEMKGNPFVKDWQYI